MRHRSGKPDEVSASVSSDSSASEVSLSPPSTPQSKNSTSSLTTTSTKQTTAKTTSTSSGTATTMLVDAPDRWKTWWVRTYTTIAMIIGFAAIIYVGYVEIDIDIVVVDDVAFVQKAIQLFHASLSLPPNIAVVSD
jgi:uncharacterized membrane protein YebE (DUF533 family)